MFFLRDVYDFDMLPYYLTKDVENFIKEFPKELLGKILIVDLKMPCYVELEKIYNNVCYRNYSIIDKKELNYFLLTTNKNDYYEIHDIDEILSSLTSNYLVLL